MDTYELGSECAMAGADGADGDEFPIDIPGGQRTMSVLLYLNDVPPEAGGATIFPRLRRRRPPDGAPPPPQQLDYHQQQAGAAGAAAPLSIAPVQGRLLAFATCLPGTNTPDPRTLHAGAPLRPLPSAGGGVGAEKWAVNKWLRERRIRPDWGREGEGVHLGMGAAELGELLGEMSEEELRQALHEEGCGGGEGGGEDDGSTHSAAAAAAAAWPVSGGGSVASAEAMRGALRRHFGLPAAGGDGGGAGGVDAACSSSMAGR
jgi:hypothetical protein